MLQHDPAPLQNIPVVMVPSQPGRGELGPLTLLQVALHLLTTLPTVAPSAGSATRTPPVVGSWWWTEHTAAISREGCRGDQQGSRALNPSPEAGQGLTHVHSSRLHPVLHTGLI